MLKLSLHNSAAFVFGKSFADICLKMYSNFLTLHALRFTRRPVLTVTDSV